MSSPSLDRNIGSYIHGVYASTARTAVDSGAYVAATYITATGLVIDRSDEPRHYNSVKIVWPIRTDLTSGHTITCDGSILHCTASGGSYATLASFTAKTFANATTATSVIVNGTYQGSADLRMAKRFLKFKLRHSGSSTATGSTVTVGTAVAVFGGAVETPATSTA